MAPPPAKKPEPKKVSDADAAGRIIVILVGIAVLAAILGAVGNLVGGAGGTSVIDAFLRFFSRTGFLGALYAFAYGPFFLVSLIVTILGFGGALYSYREYKKIRVAKQEELRMLEAKLTADASEVRNERWERIVSLVSSENPGDWRIAIIEADIALHELVRSMGYPGESLGDMLKTIEKSDFETLDLAWEAHKMRNRIAHQGSDFILTQREAKRIIDLFRQVFQEFDVI